MFSFSDNDSCRDVLVTGVGLVTPLGCSADTTWRRLLAGQRAGRELTSSNIDHFDALIEMQGLRIIGAPLDHPELVRRLSGLRLLETISPAIAAAWSAEPLISMSLIALEEALLHAKMPLVSRNPDRTAVVFGSSKGGMRTAERLTWALLPNLAAVLSSPRVPGDEPHSPRDEHLTDMPEEQFGSLWSHAFQADSATRALTAVTGAKVASNCPVAACATGLIAVLQGAAMVHAGLCDVCIVGSADAGLRASVLASFHRLRVTSRNSDAASACRPFDSSRDGFIVGEGAAVMILESRLHAEARSATPLAKVTGGGWLNDPTGLTQIDTSGSVVAELLRRVILNQLQWPDIIGLHGTGTEPNDLAEARGVRSFFGQSPIPPCFAVKGAIGHLLGAAGSVETALTILSLHHQHFPGTANLQSPDSRCRIPLVSHGKPMLSIRRAAKLSLGFGGHVACGLFERASQ